MNDWMRPEPAWLYKVELPAAVAGTIVHTACNSNEVALFVPNGGSIYDGVSVSDREGVAVEAGVWYTDEVPYEMARRAIRKYWEDRLELTELEVRTIKRTLEKLGVETKDEAGAE